MAFELEKARVQQLADSEPKPSRAVAHRAINRLFDALDERTRLEREQYAEAGR